MKLLAILLAFAAFGQEKTYDIGTATPLYSDLSRKEAERQFATGKYKCVYYLEGKNRGKICRTPKGFIEREHWPMPETSNLTTTTNSAPIWSDDATTFSHISINTKTYPCEKIHIDGIAGKTENGKCVF